MSEIINPIVLLFSKQPSAIGLFNIIEQIENFFAENDLDPEVFKELIDLKVTFCDDDENIEQNLQKMKDMFNEFSKLMQEGIIAAQIEYKQRRKKVIIEKEIDGVGEDQKYTVEEIAKKLKLSRQTVYNKIKAGQIPAVQVSARKSHITQKAYEDYLKKYNK